MTNSIQQLAKRLRAEYPGAAIDLDEPKHSNGVWWINFSLGPNSAEIEWREGQGFGLSVNCEATYGERSDEAHATVEATFERVKELFSKGSATEPPFELLLRTIRQSRKMTQSQLAKLLRVKQASISKLESRADMHISTLRNILEKLGAELELRVVFPAGDVYLVQFEKAATPPSQKKARVRRRNTAARSNVARHVSPSRTVR